MKILNLLSCGFAGGIETLCNNIDRYSEQDNYWIFLFKFGEIAEEMKRRNPNKVIFLGYSKINLLKFLKTLDKFIKENKIEIVTMHHNGIYCNLIFSYLKYKNSNIKFVRFLHSCYEDEYSLKRKWLYDKVYLYFLNKSLQTADLLISVSNAVKRSYEEKFDLKNANNIVIYNGIDIQFYEKEQIVRKKTNTKSLNLVFVGRLVNEKGVDKLITSVKNLLNKGIDLNLTIIGDGIETINLKKLSSGYEKNIKFVGKQINIMEWLDKFDVFVYPSVWKEAFGISVVEAMSRGCIPIVSNKGGLVEIINTDDCGYVFDGTNEDLEKKIMNIMNLNELEKNKIIENSIKISKKFSIKNTIERIFMEFEKIM